MNRAILAGFACLSVWAMTGVVGTASAKEIYLDKLDQTLDDWWNMLDEVCRGSSGEESDLACDQRLELDKLLIGKHCRNVYPGTDPEATSYRLCNW